MVIANDTLANNTQERYPTTYTRVYLYRKPGTAIFSPDGYYKGLIPNVPSGEKREIIDHGGNAIALEGVCSIEDAIRFSVANIEPKRTDENHIRNFLVYL